MAAIMGWLSARLIEAIGRILSTPPGAASSSSDPSDSSSFLEDLDRLRRMLLRIQALLADAEKREIHDEAVKLWLKELTDVAYEADDVVDEYKYEVLRAQVESRDSRKRKRADDQQQQLQQQVCDPCRCIQVSIPDGMGERISKIRERFEEIARDRAALSLTEEDGPRRTDEIYRPPPTSSHVVDELGIFGREVDKENIIKMLLSEENDCSSSSSSSRCSVSVLPIVGMGGIGKTTLAQLVYNDPIVRRHFTTRGWVCVSDDFDVVRLTKAILRAVAGESCCDDQELDVLQTTLREALQGKRFLIVLDDVWNEKPSLWEALRASFSGVGSGKIIVTTRNDSVARIMQTMPPYRPGCLPEGQCLLLFQAHAFHGRDADKEANLREIGEKIVNKCGGLPLAVKALGGLLRYEDDEERWLDILQSDLWELEETKTDILPALRLSYDRMPTYLKPCFQYSSLFPKDTEFEKHVLIRLWLAQGYVQPRGNKILEDIAGQYFDELQGRSFINRARDKRFVLHDMVHDLARSIQPGISHITSSETYNKGSHNYLKDVRHLYDDTAWGSKSPVEIPVNTPLRTLVSRGRSFSKDWFLDFGCLRALILGDSPKAELPDSIGSLKHLRYLRIEQSIRSLPESIWQLHNLQTLDLRQSPIEQLPKDIGRLTNLRDLFMPELHCEYYLPAGFGKLTNLQQLRGDIRAGRDRQQQGGGIGELKELVKLRGELHIVGLDCVRNAEDAKAANLASKGGIERLTLSDYSLDGHNDDLLCTESSTVLEHLRPHTNLKELKIFVSRSVTFPKWMADPSFSKLTRIKLSVCISELLPPFGQLPSLKILEIQHLEGVRCVGPEFCGNTAKVGFPSLEELSFEALYQWEEWRGPIDGHFPRLRKLCIRNCPQLRELPALHGESTIFKETAVALPLLEEPVFEEMPEREGWAGVLCGDFPRLHTLEIIRCRNLISLPILSSLHQSNMFIGELQILTSLQHLTLQHCDRLQLLPDQRLPSNLLTLDISYCSKLRSLPGLGNLNRLESLRLERCPVLELLPDEQFQSRPPSVEITDCPQLTEWCKLHEVQYISGMTQFHLRELAIQLRELASLV